MIKIDFLFFITFIFYFEMRKENHHNKNCKKDNLKAQLTIAEKKNHKEDIFFYFIISLIATIFRITYYYL